MKKLLSIVVSSLLALIITNTPAFAQTKWYKVEIIVVRPEAVFQADGHSKAVDKAQTLASFPSNAQTLVANENHLFYKPYEILPERSKTLLNSNHPSLQNKMVLMNLGWLQKLDMSGQTVPVHVYGAPEVNNSTQNFVAYNPEANWAIDGWVKFSANNPENPHEISFDAEFLQAFQPHQSQGKTLLNMLSRKTGYEYYLSPANANLTLGQERVISTPNATYIVKVSQFS